MTLPFRIIFSGAGAAIITTGLGLTMVKLIHVNYEAAPKADKLEFVLNPIVEDITITARLTPVEPLKTVVPPPPLPVVDHQTATAPTTPPPLPPTEPVKFDPTVIDDVGDTPFAEADAIPILRFAPTMPTNADRSGHCKMIFDVGPDGAPFNVKALSCSDRIFARNSIKATEKFKYRPKRSGGQNVVMNNITTTIRYQLTDERGQIIPEA